MAVLWLRSLPGTVFDVKYSPNVVRIDLATTQKTLRSVSDDGKVFVFESDDPRLRDLREGKIWRLRAYLDRSEASEVARL